MTEFLSLILDEVRANREQLQELEVLIESHLEPEPPKAPTRQLIITTNQEKDRQTWDVGSVIANHGIWRPSEEGTSEEEQRKNLRKLWAQVAAFEQDANLFGGPAIFDTDGRGTWWYLLIKKGRRRIITPDTLGLRHFSIFDQWTSRHLRHPEATWTLDRGLQLHDPEVTRETLDALDNKSGALGGNEAILVLDGRVILDDRRRLAWSYGSGATSGSEPISLQGITPTFGALHTNRIDPIAVVQHMAEMGSNYQRWWVGFEPWTAIAKPEAALSPWAGTWRDYDLHNFNPVFWSRLRETNVVAAELGVVMHYSLMNHASFMNTHERKLWGVPGWNRWEVNPWNAINNRLGRNLQGLIPPDGARRGTYPREIFSTSGEVWKIWKAFLEKFRDTVGGFGNVMVELANEPPGKDMTQEREWHQACAEVLTA